MTPTLLAFTDDLLDVTHYPSDEAMLADLVGRCGFTVKEWTRKAAGYQEREVWHQGRVKGVIWRVARRSYRPDPILEA